MRNTITFVFLIFLLYTPKLYSQTPVKVESLSDEQIDEFYKKAQSSGLSELQIEQLALQRGYTQEDITKIRERIGAIVTNSSQKSINSEMPNIPRIQNTANVSPAPSDQLPVIGPNTKAVIEKKPVYGASFFNNDAPSFEPNLRIPTPQNYVLGPEDELSIDMFGSSLKSYKQKISPEGAIQLENSGPIYVSGLNIEQAKVKITSKLKQLYSMPGIGISVTLGNIRSIKVTITGEVIRPGTYTISSLSSVFNAIYQSGGPNSNGSFRNIQLRRGNKIIRNIDLYDFLLSGDEKDNIGLKDQDVIFFPDFEVQIEMSGEVRRPYIFESKQGETVKDVLRFAGGFKGNAYTANISVRRNTTKELKILTINEQDLATFIPNNGDIFTIGTILGRFENRVQIAGAVFRPGEYSFDPSLNTVKQLIERAEGIRGDAFLARAYIRREKQNLEIENVSFDLGKLLKGEIEDIPIQRQDSLAILSINDLKEKYIIQINGAVNRPGTFTFVENMSISDLIALSGGFQEGAISSRIEVSRRIKTNLDTSSVTKNVQVFTFNIDKDLKLSETDVKFSLEPYDVVFVRNSPNYEVQNMVGIYGQVNYPGKYTIETKEDRLEALIKRAGGIKSDAYINASRFYRQGELVAVDLTKILKDPKSNDNLKLINLDSLVIPRKDELVRITGAVLNPSTVNYDSPTLEQYISQAGGFTELASKKRIYVIYANGKVTRTKKALFFRNYPKIEAGSQIVIPGRTGENKAKMDPTERIAVFSLLGSILIATGSVLASILRN